MKISQIIVCALLALGVYANIWDNVFSRLDTTHHIVFPDSDSFQMRWKRTLSQYVLGVSYVRGANISISLNLEISVLFSQPIFDIEADLDKHILQVYTPTNCNRIQLPHELEIGSRGSNYTIDPKKISLETLIVFGTRFVKVTDQQLYEYQVAIPRLSEQTLQKLRPNKRMLQRIPPGLGILGNMMQNFGDDEQGAFPLDMMLGEPYSDQEDQLQDNNQEVVVHLYFDKDSLQSIQYNSIHIPVIKKKKPKSMLKSDKCHEEDWTNKSLQEIITSIQNLILINPI